MRMLPWFLQCMKCKLGVLEEATGGVETLSWRGNLSRYLYMMLLYIYQGKAVFLPTMFC